MGLMCRLGLLLLFFLASTVSASLPQQQDPYVVLGVRKDASQKDVKQAYKRLALEWHPDRNNSPEAGEKFMAINQAYEVLGDTTRREQFDRFGTYDSPQQHHQPHRDFEEFFNFAFGGGGNGGQRAGSSFDRHRITQRMYTHSLLEKSNTQPFIIYAYSSYCHLCFMLEPAWREAVGDLEALGYGIGTVNYMMDGNLFATLRITQIPSLLVVVEGRVVHYRGTMNTLTAKAIRLFARDSIPGTFLNRINSYSLLRRFLDQWQATNKPSVLILGGKDEPRLRYLLPAMKYSHFMRFAYIPVHSNSPYSDVKEMKKALGIQCSDCENILVFKERPDEGPMAKIAADSGRQFTMQEISSLLEQNKFLQLPRISSQAYFDELCPVSSSRAAKHLCIILTLEGKSEEQSHLEALRATLRSSHGDLLRSVDGGGKGTLSYVHADKQKEFMDQFRSPASARAHNNAARDVLVLWRFEYARVKYTWLRAIWNGVDGSEGRKSVESLKENIYLLQRGTLRMDSTATLRQLVDEYTPSWFTRASRSLVRAAQTVWYNLSKEESLPILSVVGTLLFIFFIGYGLNQLSGSGTKDRFFREEEELLRKQTEAEQKEWVPEDPKIAGKDPEKSKMRGHAVKQRMWREMEPMIHELRAETYFGLIRLLKPGCRSVILLVDTSSKEVLLPQFAKHVYPLRNNKTFSFGFLMVNKNLAWFRSLLEHTLPNDEGDKEEVQQPSTSSAALPKPALTLKERLKDINPKQTLGTVLVLCGYKLYFSIYHPMHSTKRTTRSSNNYVGFDCNEEAGESRSDDEVEDEANQHHHKSKQPQKRERKGSQGKRELNLDNVLNGFSAFLDRLLEGSIRRYYIPEWPDNLK